MRVQQKVPLEGFPGVRAASRPLRRTPGAGPKSEQQASPLLDIRYYSHPTPYTTPHTHRPYTNGWRLSSPSSLTPVNWYLLPHTPNPSEWGLASPPSLHPRPSQPSQACQVNQASQAKPMQRSKVRTACNMAEGSDGSNCTCEAVRRHVCFFDVLVPGERLWSTRRIYLHGPECWFCFSWPAWLLGVQAGGMGKIRIKIR
jgi:hypothetical protein